MNEESVNPSFDEWYEKQTICKNRPLCESIWGAIERGRPSLLSEVVHIDAIERENEAMRAHIVLCRQLDGFSENIKAIGNGESLVEKVKRFFGLKS